MNEEKILYSEKRFKEYLAALTAYRKLAVLLDEELLNYIPITPLKSQLALCRELDPEG